MKSFARILCLSLTLASSAAFAQATNVRVRGTVEKIDGQTVSVKTDKGDTVSMMLAPNYSVTAVVKKTIADLKEGVFIGVGAKPQADGTLKAIQVSIFPEALRGTGEGHRDWSAMPQTTMTNATIASSVKSVDGDTIMLKYKDGEKKVVIGSDAKIIGSAPAEKSDLKVGTEFVTTASKGADGMLTASRITVGKDGVSPPL